MQKIMHAMLRATVATDQSGSHCEWDWVESSEAEHGREWNGDVKGYADNLELPDGVEIDGEYSGSIHNLPEGAVVLTHNGKPITICWAENPIKEMRERQRLTQEQMSKALGIGLRQYQRIEAGVQPLDKISFASGLKLAEIFDVEPEELLKCQ